MQSGRASGKAKGGKKQERRCRQQRKKESEKCKDHARASGNVVEQLPHPEILQEPFSSTPNAVIHSSVATRFRPLESCRGPHLPKPLCFGRDFTAFHKVAGLPSDKVTSPCDHFSGMAVFRTSAALDR